MTFDERKKIATEKLVDFLADFSAPRGLDDSQMAKRITQIADAFARRMPIGSEYEDKVDALLLKLRDTHVSNSWPPQAAFVELMPKTEFRKSAPATYQPENENWLGRQMRAGQPVPMSQIWGSVEVDRDVLDKYRFAAVDQARSVYGPDAERFMVSKYGPTVHRYFLEAAQ